MKWDVAGQDYAIDCGLTMAAARFAQLTRGAFCSKLFSSLVLLTWNIVVFLINYESFAYAWTRRSASCRTWFNLKLVGFSKHPVFDIVVEHACSNEQHWGLVMHQGFQKVYRIQLLQSAIMLQRHRKNLDAPDVLCHISVHANLVSATRPT